MKCPMCNENLPDDSAFCTECGNPISQAAPPPPAEVAPPPPPAEVAPPPPPAQVAPPPPPAQVAPPPPPAEVAPPPPPPAQPQPRLELPDGSTVPIDAEAKAVGRVELLNCLNSLPGVDPNVVSRKHFSILFENGKYHIEDGNTIVQEKPSANHTYIKGEELVDGACVTKELECAEGEELVDGACVPIEEEGPDNMLLYAIIGGAIAAVAIGAGFAISKSKKGGSSVGPVTRTHCGGCGSEIDPQYKFCRKCGKSLPKSAIP